MKFLGHSWVSFAIEIANYSKYSPFLCVWWVTKSFQLIKVPEVCFPGGFFPPPLMSNAPKNISCQIGLKIWTFKRAKISKTWNNFHLDNHSPRDFPHLLDSVCYSVLCWCPWFRWICTCWINCAPTLFSKGNWPAYNWIFFWDTQH